MLLFTAGYLYLQFRRMQQADTSDFDTDAVIVDIPEEEEKKMDRGYINIALFGVDSRQDEIKNHTRSDTIMIVSINKKTKDVNVVSVYRDTVMYTNEKHGYDKATHAYAYGGPELSVQMLNRTLDLNITEFITVNFNSLAMIVDALGGVEIDVSEEEVEYVNKFGSQVAELIGTEYKEVTKAGKQTLNGEQAVGYCRIRSTAGGDFTRSSRQRIVLEKLFDKIKKAGPIKLAKVAESIFPNVYTSMGLADVMALIPGVASYSLASSEGFPFDASSGRLGKASVVYANPNLYQNVIQLHEKLFGTEDYEPSSRVENYSKEINSYR
ncbi:MAG: LCP family protein [Lachnospiraceae bacterium]|nr:LCP family protein [Lachnospiraceae bacterium]MBQ9563824.1 LCP family protein [Lachnospiraceae bacterium]